MRALLGPVVSFVSYLLTFIALVMFAMVIYAGFTLLLSLGNEERLTQARGLLGRVALGSFVILTSLALVNFVIGPTFLG